MYSRVYVEITNICNMNCSFCHGHSRPHGQMKEEAFCHILSQLKGKTEYLYYHLMGEPLTHPDLPRFIRLATDAGFHSVLTTNGTLLHKRGEELLAAKPHKVSISLHSFENGTKEDHLGYLENIASFLDLAKDADTIVCLRLWNKGFDAGKNDDTLSFLQNRIAGEWTPNTRGLRVRDKQFLEWGDRFAWPDMAAEIVSQQVSCYGLRDQFGVLCDGTVVPCCLDSEGAINLGNIFQTPLEEILNSPRATAMAEGFRCRKATEDLCRRCGYATRFSKEH